MGARTRYEDEVVAVGRKRRSPLGRDEPLCGSLVSGAKGSVKEAVPGSRFRFGHSEARAWYHLKSIHVFTCVQVWNSVSFCSVPRSGDRCLHI